MSRADLLAVLQAHSPRAKMARMLKEATEREQTKEAAAQLLKAVGTGLAKGVGQATNFARGAMGAGATKGVQHAQNLVGTVGARNRGALQSMVGKRVIAGSPEHRMLQRAGATFRSRGTVPMQGGVPVKPTIKNLEKLRAGPGNTGGQVDARLNAMLSSRRANPRARIQTPSQLPQNVMQDVRAGSQRAMEAARQYAPQQAAHRAGQAVAPVARPAAAVLGGVGAAGAAGYGLDKMGAEDLARVKLAVRIINGDTGLEAIISHIKAARSKKTAAQQQPPAPAAAPAPAGGQAAPAPAGGQPTQTPAERANAMFAYAKRVKEVDAANAAARARGPAQAPAGAPPVGNAQTVNGVSASGF